MRSIEASLTRKDGVKEEPGSTPPIRVDVRVVGKTLTKATAVEASDALSPTLTSSGKSNKDLSRQVGQCSTVRTWGQQSCFGPRYLFETDYKPTINTIYNYAHTLSSFLLYFLSCVHKILCITIVEIRRQFEMFESSAKTPFGVKIHGLCC